MNQTKDKSLIITVILSLLVVAGLLMIVVAPSVTAAQGTTTGTVIATSTAGNVVMSTSGGVRGTADTCDDAQAAAEAASEEWCEAALEKDCETLGGTGEATSSESSSGPCIKLGDGWTSIGFAKCSMTCIKE